MSGDFKGIITKWHGTGFGEAVYASLFCHILNDNGIKSVFRPRKSTWELMDVPLYDPEKHDTEKGWVWWHWKYEKSDVPIMQQQANRVSEWLKKEIIINRDHVPVIFEEMDVPEVDVVMNTKTSHWTPYKLWPYFDELKIKMAKLGITYYDFDVSETYGIECLNMVKKAQIYLGLDSGMAHYVSRFANGKTLILSGGFVTFEFWAYLYDYEPVQIEDVPCRPCFKSKHYIKRGEGCPFDNRCMTEITVDMVMNKICERLK